MTKRKLKKEVKKIIKILTLYFGDDEKLEILDGREFSDEGLSYYKGVTVPYISKYLLKNKYSLDIVAASLFKYSLDNKRSGAFICSDINQLIFHNYYLTDKDFYSGWGNPFTNDDYETLSDCIECDLTEEDSKLFLNKVKWLY